MTTTAERATPALAGRMAVLTYGVTAYAAFLVVFLYAVAFVEDLSIVIGSNELVPRTIEAGGPTSSTGVALVVDLLLLLLFAGQHSVMARAGFKRRWTRIVPAQVERSTFVLCATACLAVLMWWWHPVGPTVWEVSGSPLSEMLTAVSLAGWVVVLVTTFLINHWDLFGLRQVVAYARTHALPSYRFVTPLWYGLVRHPIYLGFLIAFWVTPTMSVGHLLFAAAMAGYILAGIQLEEQDLVAAFGEDYQSYRRRVPMLVPGARRRR